MGLVLLVGCWGAAAAAARALLSRGGEARPALIAALASALLAVVPGQLCRLTGSLPLAMALAALAFAVIAWTLRGVVAGPATDARPAWPALLVGVTALACVVHGAWFRNFFDDEIHVPMALALAHGVAPIEHPLLPGQVMPYHWGVDALYAQLVSAGLGIERAIDLVTIGCFALLLWTAATLGAMVAGRAGATLYPVIAPLAGSALAQPLHDDLGPFAIASRYPEAWREWTRRPPPITADFFQHPQGLAMPLDLAVLALFTVERDDVSSQQRAVRRAVGALLLGCLSLVQAVHFLVLGFGLAAAALCVFARTRDARRLGADLLMLLAAGALAVLLGGFFSPGANTKATLVWGLDFFRATSLADSLAHHLVAFGLPLLLLPLALLPHKSASSARLRFTLVLGAACGMLLPNVVVYRHTWDIVKLYSAGGFLAGVACADTLARAWRTPTWRLRPASWRAGLSSALVVVLALATIEFPLVWLASRTILQGQAGIPRKVDWRVRPELNGLGHQLRALIPARDRVLLHSVEVARGTGLFSPGFDARRYASGHIVDFSRTRTQAQARAQALVDMSPAALDTLEVRWVLMSAGELARLGPTARAALDDPSRFEVARRNLPGGFTLWRRRARRYRRRGPRAGRALRARPARRRCCRPRTAWPRPR